MSDQESKSTTTQPELSGSEEPIEGEATEVGAPDGSDNGAEPRALMRRERPLPLSQRDPVAIAKHFAASGYFTDARQMSQAVVKIVAGEELGFGPMTAMAGIHIIEGKPALSANLIATLVKRSTSYTYRVVAIDDEAAELCFIEGGEEIGRSKFTIEMAQRAGLVKDKSGWVKFPEAMLFARALTQGVRWFCPDVTAGAPAYTAEELGAVVDERGEVVTLPATQVAEPQEQATADTITKKRGGELANAAKQVGVDWQRLRLVASNAAGRDVGEFTTKAQARDALSTLAASEADEVEEWLNSKADEAADE